MITNPAHGSKGQLGMDRHVESPQRGPRPRERVPQAQDCLASGLALPAASSQLTLGVRTSAETHLAHVKHRAQGQVQTYPLFLLLGPSVRLDS